MIRVYTYRPRCHILTRPGPPARLTPLKLNSETVYYRGHTTCVNCQLYVVSRAHRLWDSCIGWFKVTINSPDTSCSVVGSVWIHAWLHVEFHHCSHSRRIDVEVLSILDFSTLVLFTAYTQWTVMDTCTLSLKYNIYSQTLFSKECFLLTYYESAWTVM